MFRVLIEESANGGKGSVAEVLPQISRLAASRSKAVRGLCSVPPAEYGQERPVDSSGELVAPVHMEPLVLSRAITQIEINQALVRDSAFL